MRNQTVVIPPAASSPKSKKGPRIAPKTQPETATAATLIPPTPLNKHIRKPAEAQAALPLFPLPSQAPKAASGKVTSGKVTPPASAQPAPTKAAKAAPIKAAKTITVKAASTQPVPVRVVAETPAAYFAGAGGHAWRLSSRYAIAYVRNAALAGEMLQTEPRYLAKVAMAVYYDRKGKPFAWQFRFDTARWAEVIGQLG